MKRLGLAVVAAALLLPGMAQARETNRWQAVEGSYDGKWSEKGHWSLGRLPAGDDYVEIDGSHVNDPMAYTIEIDGDYEVSGELCIGADGKFRDHQVTFTGDGSVTFSSPGSTSNNFRYYRRGIVFDGPTFRFPCKGYLMSFSPVTVKNGSRLELAGDYFFWYHLTGLTIENGGSVSVAGVRARTGRALAGPWTTDPSGGLTVRKGGSFVCRGNMISTFESNSLADVPFFVDVDGGDVWCRQLKFNLTCKSGNETVTRKNDTVTVRNGGQMAVGSACLFNDRAQQLTVDETSAFVEQASSVTQTDSDGNWARMRDSASEVVSCGTFCATNGTLFKHRGTLVVSQLKNLDTKNPMTFDCDQLVFDGLKQPFQWTDPGTRFVYLQGPMEIQAVGTNVNRGAYSNENGYRFCRGAITVNTEDWTTPKNGSPHAVAIRGLSSVDGTLELTVKGGGTVYTCQKNAQNTMRSCRVAKGTTLELEDRGNFSKYGKECDDWGPLATELLVLESGAKVTFNAGHNFICASRWEIDPNAKITVKIPKDVPNGLDAFPVMQDLDSKALPDGWLGQITIGGSEGSENGWRLVNAYGQISVVRDPTTAVGIFSKPTNVFEWKGGVSGNKFSASNNWVDATGIAEQKTMVFGASQNANVTFDKIPGTSTTVGMFLFQTNTSCSFFIDASKGSETTYRLGSSATTIESYSSLPQLTSAGFRLSGGAASRQISVMGAGPFVFSHFRADGKTTAQTWLTKSNDMHTVSIRGDVRVGCNTSTAYGCSQFTLNLLSRASYSYYPAYRTTFTVLDGGNIEFPNQGKGDAMLTDGSSQTDLTSIRVSKGGTLTFPNGANRYGWEKCSPANMVIDGTLNIGTRMVMGTDRIVYGGSGTLNIQREIQPNNTSTFLAFGDSLQVNVTSNRWPSEGKTMGTISLAVSMGAVSGTPTVHVPADWVYGPTIDKPIRSEAVRAMRVENGATLTIEPRGGVATVKEFVTGFGAVAVTNGTLVLEEGLLNANEDELGLSVRKGATLEVKAGMKPFGSLELDAGATLKVPAGTRFELAGSASVGGATLDMGAAGSTSWKTLIAAKGRISGTPTVAGRQPGEGKFRVVRTANGNELQYKDVTGLTVIVK